jgi:hypothetical protein
MFVKDGDGFGFNSHVVSLRRMGLAKKKKAARLSGLGD